MALSSSCVFHYTSSISTLYKILQSGGFYPSYCKEKNAVDMTSFIRVPMVSFCDIPLTQTAAIGSYGKFAIGLKMDWAKRNRLNPVNYVSNQSTIFDRSKKISEALGKINTKLFQDSMITNVQKNPFGSLVVMALTINEKLPAKMNIDPNWVSMLQLSRLNIFQNTKEYEGLLERETKTTPNYRFYDEREWRYLPGINDRDPLHKPLYQELAWSKIKIKYGSKPHFNTHKLTFTPNDISYIIVDNEKRVKTIAKKLKGMFPNDYENLLPKLISFERIKSDF
ncbi:Putative abortive phage resistance protein AbiGi, antitoxin [Spirosomataceae bacterium TFI 002]|nr:Putative abortive phage resistance protein AbiGi, antitoxin [Spirosomataceae bacterium TFI 002]